MPFANSAQAADLGELPWRKSPASDPSGNCAEVAPLPDGYVAVRNSRYPDGPALVCARAELAAF